MSVASTVTIGGISSNPLLSTPEAIAGEKILTETRGEIRSYEHIIPYTEMGPFTPVLATSGKGFEKYGARFFKFVQHHIYFQKVRMAVDVVNKETIAAAKEWRDDRILYSLATGKTGVGECGEIAYTIAMKAFKANLPECFVIIFKRSTKLDNHVIFIYGKGVEKEIVENIPAFSKIGIDPLAFIEKIKSGIVLDGTLLKKPLAARDVRQCPEFVRYMKVHFLDEIEYATRIKDGAIVDENLRRAEKFKERMISVLPMIPPDPVFSRALKENEPRVCADILTDRIPNSKWSKNAEKQKIWFEGAQDKAKEIAEYLNAHGIKVAEPALAKNGNYLVMISNPDFDQIEKLPPFEQWQKEKASKE